MSDSDLDRWPPPRRGPAAGIIATTLAMAAVGTTIAIGDAWPLAARPYFTLLPIIAGVGMVGRLHLPPGTTRLPLPLQWLLAILLAAASVPLLGIVVDFHPISLLWVFALPRAFPEVLPPALRL